MKKKTYAMTENETSKKYMHLRNISVHLRFRDARCENQFSSIVASDSK